MNKYWKDAEGTVPAENDGDPIGRVAWWGDVAAGPEPEFCHASNTGPWVQPDAPPHPLDKVNDSLPYDFIPWDKDTYNRG